MKMKILISGILLAGLGYLLFSTFSSQNPDAYLQKVESKREEKKQFLKNNSQSPFQIHNIPFRPLHYYHIDPTYKVIAKVERMESRVAVTIRNSDGSSQRYLQYAWLHFKLKAEAYKLIVLKPAFGPGFFLGFADDTSGEETYGGGRYLDVETLKGDRMTLDFNLAYNPYCAYAPKFQCPLPPRENILPIAIKAGEKDFP